MQLTNRELLSFEKQLQQLQGTVIEFLFRTRINDFISATKFRYPAIREAMKKLNEEYLDLDGTNVQFEKPSTILDPSGKEIPQQPKPKTKEGKSFEEYQKKMDEFLEQSVEVRL